MGSRGPATAVVEGSVLNLSVEMSAPPTWLSTGRSRAVGRLAFAFAFALWRST